MTSCPFGFHGGLAGRREEEEGVGKEQSVGGNLGRQSVEAFCGDILCRHSVGTFCADILREGREGGRERGREGGREEGGRKRQEGAGRMEGRRERSTFHKFK